MVNNTRRRNRPKWGAAPRQPSVYAILASDARAALRDNPDDKDAAWELEELKWWKASKCRTELNLTPPWLRDPPEDVAEPVVQAAPEPPPRTVARLPSVPRWGKFGS